MVDLSKLRKSLAQKSSKEQPISLEAFDAFFSSMLNQDSLLTQSRFSELVRNNEIKLLGVDYPVTDMDGQPLTTEAVEDHFSQNVHTMHANEGVKL